MGILSNWNEVLPAVIKAYSKALFEVCLVSAAHQVCETLEILKGSYEVAKKNIILCIWCNAMCLFGLRFKKHIIFHTLYIIVAHLCSTFLKRVDFYKAYRSEKRGVL